ncbi:MAG: glycosyltransferase [Bacteroidetes bacterium]|nr:glycosyltransferase [Bacteroidota bacterium]
MHILVITPGFPENENDTSCIPAMQEYFTALLSEHSSPKITVVSIHYPYRNKTYSWKGIQVFSCGGGGKYPFKILYLMRAIIYSLKVNKKLKVNIIHSFWLAEPALIGSILGKIFKVKHICTMMGQDARNVNNYLKILPLKNIIKVALSEYHSNYFRKSTGFNPNYILPWGINKIKVDENKRPIDIIGVGSLIALKNYKLFIDVVVRLKEDYPSMNCILIGEGPEKSELLKVIIKKNLSGNITLTGQLPREEVLLKMIKSKILLHSSNYESFGLVILEGLASGCYVVCKKVGIAKETKKILIIKNIEDAFLAIKRIINNTKNFSPKIPYPIADSVSSYKKLYKACTILNG